MKRGVLIFVAGLALSVLLAVLILRSPAPPPDAPVAAAPAPPAIPRFEPPPAEPQAQELMAPAELLTQAASADAGAPREEYELVRMERGSPIIKAFDQKLWEVLRGRKNRIAYLTTARPVRQCIRIFMNRHNYTSWTFGGVGQVTVNVSGGLVSFPGIELPHPVETDRPPDPEFMGCYRRAVSTLRIKCPDCKEGEIQFQWRLRRVEWEPGSDGLGGALEPEVSDPLLVVGK